MANWAASYLSLTCYCFQVFLFWALISLSLPFFFGLSLSCFAEVEEATLFYQALGHSYYFEEVCRFLYFSMTISFEYGLLRTNFVYLFIQFFYHTFNWAFYAFQSYLWACPRILMYLGCDLLMKILEKYMQSSLLLIYSAYL